MTLQLYASFAMSFLYIYFVGEYTLRNHEVEIDGARGFRSDEFHDRNFVYKTHDSHQ
jgi:hypothetical protein